MMWVLQLMEPFKSHHAAQEALDAAAEQVGYLGGRILPPWEGRADWRLQAFFEDEPDTDWFPDGIRRVFLPFSLLHLIETKET